MSCLLPGLDAGDAHERQLLTVSLALVVTGLVLELVDLDLGALGVVDDLSGDLDGRQLGLVDRDVGAIDEEERSQRQLAADHVRDLVDLEDVADGHLVLPAALANDSVHRELLAVSRVRTSPRTGGTRERMRWAHRPPRVRTRGGQGQTDQVVPGETAAGPAGREAARRRRGAAGAAAAGGGLTGAGLTAAATGTGA